MTFPHPYLSAVTTPRDPPTFTTDIPDRANLPNGICPGSSQPLSPGTARRESTSITGLQPGVVRAYEPYTINCWKCNKLVLDYRVFR